MDDPLDGVSLFVRVVEANSFSAAADSLHLSRSAVAKSVARLEERLRVRLFHRTTRKLGLTQEGHAFYERCLRALEEVRLGIVAVEEGRLDATGRLRVSMPVLFGRRCIAPILMDLARQHPKLELDLNFSDRAVDLVGGGFDLAIRMGPLSEHPGLIAKCLARQSRVVCGSPAYLAARDAPRSVEDLPSHDLVAYGSGGAAWPWTFSGRDGKLVEIRPRGRFVFDDLDAVEDAALAGFGLAWLPDWMVQPHLASGELVQVLTEHRSLPFDAYAVWPQTPHLPRRVRFAIDALTERLPAVRTMPEASRRSRGG